MKINRSLYVFNLVMFFSIFSFAQTTNSIEANYLMPIVYKTKNSLSDNFYDVENGNLKLKKVYGAGLNYSRLIQPKWNLHLRAGVEMLTQKYELPYYARFSSTKIVKNVYEFDVSNYNLRLGLQKQVPIFSNKMCLKFGLDLVSRTMKSDSKRTINQDDVFFNIQSDSVLFAFNIFSPSNGGAFVLEINSGIEFNLNKNLKLHLDCTFMPRNKIGFSYNVLAVQAYTVDGVFYKNLIEDSRQAVDFSFQSIRVGMGLNLSF